MLTFSLFVYFVYCFDILGRFFYIFDTNRKVFLWVLRSNQNVCEVNVLVRVMKKACERVWDACEWNGNL
jgi:hypothetical protein